jgi:hypothetical protein
MKNLICSALAILSMSAAATAHAAFQSMETTLPSKINITYGKVYLPDGFDTNDQVQVVGEGMFSHLCYRSAPNLVTVDYHSKTIYVGPAAYLFSGFCLQVVLPFNKVLDVGIVEEPGTYKIVQTTDHRVMGEIRIKAANRAEPDDYLYAPISQAYFHVEAGQNQILLSGDFPNSCMSFKEIRINAQPDVIVVQPIIEMSNTQACKDGVFPFEKKFDLGKFKAGRYLLHVRSMNGRAVNTLVNVP